MSFWRDRDALVPAPGDKESRHIETFSIPARKRVPMRHSEPIDADGVFLGAAVEHELGVRFIAVDIRVKDMNESVWPSLQYAKMSARQLFRANRGMVPS